ncbi:MAG: hypothetical protein M0Z76_01015 [Gammaproteobacteria bacterium]|nr:hypothetical protein [Gammaproteobacteria bacterium]
MLRYFIGIGAMLCIVWGEAWAGAPKPLTCQAFTGHFIQLTASGGRPFEVYKTGPSSSATGILLLPGRRGLDAPILRWADRLGAQNYRVEVVNFRRTRQGHGGAKLSQQAMIAREVAAIDFLSAPGRKVVTLGWGPRGARRAFEATAAAPDRVAGTILCGGGLSVPNTLIAQTKSLVLLIAFRPSMPPAQIQNFAARMRMLGRPLFVQTYAASPQSVDPEGPGYDSPAAQAIWQRAAAFLARVDGLCRRCAPYRNYLFDYRN